MGEFTRGPEVGKTPEIDQDLLKEIGEKNHERLDKDAQNAQEKQPSLEEIRKRLEKAQEKQEKAEINDQESRASETPISIGSSLQNQQIKRTIQQTQKQLKKPDRAFSKVIHQPAIQAVSSALEGTLARPSGLLMGGLFSVIGSIVVLWICRHYGYEYNFMIGLACLAGGFTFGVIVEAVYRGFQKLFKR